MDEISIKKKNKFISHLSRKIKRLQKSEQKILRRLEECEKWAAVRHEGDLIKVNLGSITRGSSSVLVFDWETNTSYKIALNPSKTVQEEMEVRYKRAKKLEKGKVPLLKHLAEIQTILTSTVNERDKISLINTEEEIEEYAKNQPILSAPKRKSGEESAPAIFKEYISSSGMKIWVGKNARRNEQLTFQLANGRDWWLHASGYSGSHVIIRMGRLEEPDTETLKEALQLALYHSKGRAQNEGEVSFTQRKYVSRLGKKQPGLVQISKHETAWVKLDPARLKALNLHL